MKAAGILQAVVVLLLLALAASCEVSRIYSNRLFDSTNKKTTTREEIRFLESDSSNLTAVEVSDYPGVLSKSESDTTIINTETEKPIQRPPTAHQQGEVRTKRVRQ